MKIEFWSDIVCPWCALMDHRLHVALDRFEHGADVQVVHRSFQLHPDLPRSGVTQRDLFEMVGMPRAAAEQSLEPIEKLARDEGLTPYHALDRTLGPTDLAHELLAYATDTGRGPETWSAMFRAHFGEARPLWTTDQVRDFATEAGFERADVAAVLADHRYRARVDADQREAVRLGAQGAPFLVLDGRYAVPGAIGPEELFNLIRRVWAESRPVTLTVPTVGHMCTPDGCGVPDVQGA